MTQIILPRVHDLGGFQVRRAVPTMQARTVGPFVFVDHMGPAAFEPGFGVDVRPHPHIGLATVTFLWSGTYTNRDTLGSLQDINAGDVNWMTAGRGIAHSERAPQILREGQHPLHGMQTWVCLPQSAEEASPDFHHHAASTLPRIERHGILLRVVAGHGCGAESPVRVFSDTLYVAIDLQADADIRLEDSHVERALYVLEGDAKLDGADIPEKHLVLLDRGTQPKLRAKTPLRRCCSAGIRSMAIAMCGGTSCRHRATGSNRPSGTGATGVSARYQATTSSSRYPNADAASKSVRAHLGAMRRYR